MIRRKILTGLISIAFSMLILNMSCITNGSEIASGSEALQKVYVDGVRVISTNGIVELEVTGNLLNSFWLRRWTWRAPRDC